MTGRHTTAPDAGPRLRLNVAHGSWELVWAHVHRVLVINLGVVTANLPLLAALRVCHQPWEHPLFFGPLLLLTGPSVAAAFAYLEQADADGEASVRAFAQAYARVFRTALRVSGAALLLLTAAVVDAIALRTTPAGPALLPMAATTAVLAALSGIVALAHPDAARRAGLKALILAPYAVLRHWPLALVNLGLVTSGLLLINQAPLMGLAVLPGCVLFVVWHNCRFAPVLAAPAAAVGRAGSR